MRGKDGIKIGIKIQGEIVIQYVSASFWRDLFLTPLPVKAKEESHREAAD